MKFDLPEPLGPISTVIGPNVQPLNRRDALQSPLRLCSLVRSFHPSPNHSCHALTALPTSAPMCY